MNNFQKNRIGDKLHQIYQSYEYRPHSLIFPDRQNELNSLPRKLQLFLSRFAEKDDFDINELYGKRISDDDRLLKFYYDYLNTEERSYFMAFYTIDTHEVTHHVDFMTTPFGVYFHQKACMEFIALHRFLLELWKHPYIKVHSNRRNLLDFDDVLLQYPSEFALTRQWNILRGQVNFFDAYSFYGKKIQDSWDRPDEEPTFRLLGQDFEKITVNDFMYTIKIPGKELAYLRPISILETRGLVHSMQWILYQLGYDKRSVSEVITYLKTFYSSEGIFPDYTFLLNTFFHGLGKLKNFHDIKNVDGIGLDRFLSIVSQLCWYALHAPPSTSQSDIYTSSPVIRLLLAINAFSKSFGEDCPDILSGKSVNPDIRFDLSGMFDVLDKSKGILSANSILKLSLDTVEYMKDISTSFLKNIELRDHFYRILQTQEYQLKKRLDSMMGYSSYFGAPQYGHPFYGIKGEKDADQLMPDMYRPSDGVEDWFTQKENYSRTNVFKDDFYKTVFQKIFHAHTQDEISSIRMFEDIHLTTSFSYQIEEDKDGVFLSFHDDILPKVNMNGSPGIQQEIREYPLTNCHLVLHVELMAEQSREYRKMNIYLCPLKIKEDPNYKNRINKMLEQTYDPTTRSYNSKELVFRIMSYSTAEIFKNNKLSSEEITAEALQTPGFLSVISTRLDKMMKWYKNFVLPNLDNLPSDALDVSKACQFCRIYNSRN